jgi:chromosome partitioning protein
MSADAILMPVCESAFDREAAAQCWAELAAHPRVASGKCRVAVVGMRIDARTRAEQTLRAWAEVIGAPFLGVLRDTQAYVRCIERGLTLFDLQPAKVQADLEQWAPLLDWLDPLWASRDLGTPSQAGALEQPAATPPAPEVRRVVPRPGPARPVLEELAAALRPAAARPRPEPRRWFGAAWWPWARA